MKFPVNAGFVYHKIDTDIIAMNRRYKPKVRVLRLLFNKLTCLNIDEKPFNTNLIAKLTPRPKSIAYEKANRVMNLVKGKRNASPNKGRTVLIPSFTTDKPGVLLARRMKEMIFVAKNG